MPAHAATSSSHAGAIAPDGIAIHLFELPPAAFVGVAEGRIPPGWYGVHRHLSLEQYTYVVAGHLTAITGTESHPHGQPAELSPGSLLLTAPGESLQFVNEGTEEARVLFICAPPYPPDDADTVTLAEHAPPTAAERTAMVARLETVRATIIEHIDARIAHLRGEPA